MSEQKIFEIPASAKEKAWIDNDTYLKMYQESVEDPEGFWNKQADRLDWFKKWDRTLDWDYNKAYIRWYEGGKLNVSHNCLDRHLEARGDQKALIWESDDPNVDRSHDPRTGNSMFGMCQNWRSTFSCIWRVQLRGT